MSTSLTKAPKQLMREHRAVLQDYAWRSVIRGEPLSAEEDEDRLTRLKEFMAIGASFKLTEAELVAQVYREIFRRKAQCDCHSCRAKRAD